MGDISVIGHEGGPSGAFMQRAQSTWISRFKQWTLGYDPKEVLEARQAVSHLKPAVVVTGGARGIGLAIARRFLEAGHTTVIVGRHPEELNGTIADLSRTGKAEVVPIVCDITEPNAVATIAAGLQKANLYLDILVNNAGVGLAGPFLTHTNEEIARVLSLNIESLTRLTRAALPGMVARQRGGILNVASIGACAPGPHQAVYYASKSYVLAFTEAIAAEAGGPGVTISAVLPGAVDTGFHKAMGAERSLYRFILPSLTPERVANSAYRGFVMGQRVIVPGMFNSALFLTLRLLPHPLTVPFVGWLLKRRNT